MYFHHQPCYIFHCEDGEPDTKSRLKVSPPCHHTLDLVSAAQICKSRSLIIFNSIIILSYLTFIHKLRFITPQTRWCQLPKCSCRNPAFFLSSPVELCCLYLTPICVSITIYTSVTSVEINLQGAIQKIIWYVCIGFFFI